MKIRSLIVAVIVLLGLLIVLYIAFAPDFFVLP